MNKLVERLASLGRVGGFVKVASDDCAAAAREITSLETQLSEYKAIMLGEIDKRGAVEKHVTWLEGEVARVEAEVADAAHWNSIVERVGLDGFDAAAELWMAHEPVARMNNAVCSVFAKWANDEIMGRFKTHMTTTIHQAFVEGAIVGSRAMEVAIGDRTSTAEARLEEAVRVVRVFRKVVIDTSVADEIGRRGEPLVAAIDAFLATIPETGA